MGSKSGMRASPDQYVQVGDVRTRYRVAGEADPPLVLIHGMSASLESWLCNMDELALRHRTIALDVVWFGKSDKPAREVSGDYLAGFMTAFMDAVGVPHAVLVGNSMGGMIAVKTALQYPDRVAGLVLVNPAGFGPELTWWLRLRAVLPIAKILRPTVPMYRFAVRGLVYDPRVVPLELLQAFVEMGNLPGAPEAHRRVLRYGVGWRGLKPEALREVRDAAHAIRVPTLIIWGRQDRVVPVAHAEIARQSIPNARLQVFDRCGHAPMVEKPDEFNAVVIEFVASHFPPRVV